MAFPAILALLIGVHLPIEAECEEYRNSKAYRLNLDGAASVQMNAVANAPEDSGIGSVLVQAPAPASDSRLARMPYAALIHRAAAAASLDPALVHAVIYVESRYNPSARSPKGAIGLMQVMRETALRYGIKDPERTIDANLAAGTRYLSDLMKLFPGRLDLVLAAYNAGENAVVRYRQRIPPFQETLRYVPAVLQKYSELREPAMQVMAMAEPATAIEIRASRIEYLPGTRFDPLQTGLNIRLSLPKARKEDR